MFKQILVLVTATKPKPKLYSKKAKILIKKSKMAKQKSARTTQSDTSTLGFGKQGSNAIYFSPAKRPVRARTSVSKIKIYLLIEISHYLYIIHVLLMFYTGCGYCGGRSVCRTKHGGTGFECASLSWCVFFTLPF